MSSVSLYLCLTVVFETVSHRTCSSPIELDYLASRLHGSSCFYLPEAWITGTHIIMSSFLHECQGYELRPSRMYGKHIPIEPSSHLQKLTFKTKSVVPHGNNLERVFITNRSDLQIYAAVLIQNLPLYKILCRHLIQGQSLTGIWSLLIQLSLGPGAC